VSDLWLAPDEVIDLTGKQRWTAQCRALAAMGVPFKPNAVGRPLVERAVAAPNSAATKPRAKREPNWNAIKMRA
jgi:hypothetical protein